MIMAALCCTRPTRMRLVAVTIAVLVSACSQTTAPDVNTAQHSETDPQYGELSVVPADYVGNWVRVREICEADSEEVPRTNLPPIRLMLTRQHRFTLVEDGRTMRGRFIVERFVQGTRLRLLDSLRNFDAVDGRLENWGEGDAVYICGQIYERSAG